MLIDRPADGAPITARRRGTPLGFTGDELGVMARFSTAMADAMRRHVRELEGRLPGMRPALGSQLAVLVDGAYTSAAHLGPDGPAADGLRLARHLIQERR